MPSGRADVADRAPHGEATRPGSYFVSNYPPYSFWRPESAPEAEAALDRAPRPGTPLGLYVHLPFCRKRCHFCYFKVYTGATAAEIQRYLDAVAREIELVGARALVAGRRPAFIYFGGGTPSYLSEDQLRWLTGEMTGRLPWDAADEVTFECEPGTLSGPKLRAIRDLGVTRLSLGIESFSDRVLVANGRAHLSRDVDRAFRQARDAGFPQINVDLIAGMLGETESDWSATVDRTVALAAESVTIYQMEVPYNTTIFRDMKSAGRAGAPAPVAGWDVKRARVDRAFAALEAAGYTVASAYTAVREPASTRFVYRDQLWRGADLIGLGVASFSHAAGVHYQNVADLPDYLARLDAGRLPIGRALTPTAEELLIRELILQLKLGLVQVGYFRDKFGVDVKRRFARPLARLRAEGALEPGSGSASAGELKLTRRGLLAVDGLLPEFYLDEHREARQTPEARHA
jgi:oxygen-independent coproporphyrinogen-3 oxidase